MAISKDQLLAKIDKLFVDVNEQYADLTKNTKLKGLEIALLASNIEYLAAQIKALHYFEESKSTVEPIKPQPSFFTPSSLLDKDVDEQETFNEIDEDPMVIVKEVSKNDIFSADVAEEKARHEEAQPLVDEVISSIVEVENESVAETLFTKPIVEEVRTVVQEVVEEESVNPIEEAPARPLTINELIQQQKQAGVNLTQQFQTSTAQDKVVDLKTAISLNDKLLFIKDLFNGYSLAYSEALELLNRFDSYAEADAFLQSNYALKNGWAEKPQTVDKFYSLLRKKFNA